MLPQSGWAQAERNRPMRADAPKKPAAQAPAKEATAGAESSRKLEENLRLLLRLDSLQSARRKVVAGLEISGLVVDQSITKPARDFYDLFYSQWEAPAGIQEYTIIIGEKPARATSTLLTLRVNEEDLLEFPLQPSFDLIQDAVTEAIAYVQDYMVQQQNLSQQLEKGGRVAIDQY
ncbi:CsgE family curli-type amyloid fiber assembly protein [Hymenobacter rigui]|uniref:CsgE family curli-type amyloid fiber assembly protein n=1 Tax=Hymenobacter rigui TaxID=334424 RepID=UPI00147742D6|nr:CsgE family curli-type amyloid fiber assembly protein [Hymenobacter rigui]